MKCRSQFLLVLVFFGAWMLIPGPLFDLRADEEEDESIWSLRPVRAVAPPEVRDTGWLRSPVDSFILARLEANGLGPSLPADRRMLIRRATFDLIGLPPTPEEIAAFLSDDSPQAFACVVDRLLASPQYGQRWGRHWLDVVRYADARDLIQLPAESDFREAWRYRDWVVDAFNRDLPYDQFVMHQVAGDLLQPNDPAKIDAAALVATGMLAIADFVPGDVDKQQMIADYVNDQIDVVGRGFLGLTLACARCHDHKFDPISMEDYYSLAGIFFSTRLIPGPVKGNTPLVRAPLLSAAEIAALEAEHARDQARLLELSREVEILAEREYRSHLQRQVATETERYLLAAWEFSHPAAGQTRLPMADFSQARRLNALTLERWTEYLAEKRPHVALKSLCEATDQQTAKTIISNLGLKLRAIAAERHAMEARDAIAKTLAESELLRFRADEVRTVADDAGRVIFWPNRARSTPFALPVPLAAAPILTAATIKDQSRPILRFSGQELLHAPGTVPPRGSLFVAYRPDPAGKPGQRLIGWEDASVGQHGLGIMIDPAGSVHAILRNHGANGDVVSPAPAADLAAASAGFQIASITWGPKGVAFFRNGQAAGNNGNITSVSSDPAINALQIGGPGSGSGSRFQGELAELRVYNLPLDDETRTRVEKELMDRWLSPAKNQEDADPLLDFYEELVSARSPFRLDPAEREKALPEEFRQTLAAMHVELETLQKKPPPEIPRAVVVQEGGPPGTPHEGFQDARIYLRGNHAMPGGVVPRGFPKAIAPTAPPIQTGSGRRELARWLVDPKNPLTARVMANRVWQHHFGVGLAPTSANFGVMGEPPTHPELLDFLAARLVESGWSLKSLHRLIMLSNAYQQHSGPNAAALEADPENRWLWRVQRRRLEAEALRDSLFAVAGRLDLTAGGPGFQDVATPRRSLYLMSVRTGAKTSDFGPLFDAAECTGIVERRSESIVAPQALFLLNDPLVAELAAALGERVDREVVGGSDRERIGRLYEIVLGRPPTEAEAEIGLRLLADKSQLGAWSGYCRLLLSTNEFLFVD